MEIFATAEFVPTEDITTYELARVVKFTMACSHGLGVAEPIKFSDIYAYNKFILEYNDVLKYFNIVVYGNYHKFVYDFGGAHQVDEKGFRVK